MIHDIVLQLNPNLDKLFHFTEVNGDTIVFNFTIDGVDLTGWEIRGEVYDLNTSIRLANTNAGGGSAPNIDDSEAADGKFTATVDAGATGTFQKYGQVEFTLTNPQGHKFTIMQQLITFSFERIIWTNPGDGVTEGQNPLF